MTENRVVALRQKGAVDDPLTEILRAGARRLIAQAVEAEFETFLVSTSRFSCFRMAANGWFATGVIRLRAIQTGIGPVEVRSRRPAIAARRRRRGSGSLRISCRNGRGARRAWTRCCRFSICAGFRAGDFQETLAALLGKDAPNLSAAVIGRLKSEWENEYRQWQKRDLSARHYVYVWADGVYLQARMEPQAECMLVLMGATAEGKKELIGLQTGMRESGQSWKELLRRFEGARLGRRAASGHWRWRARVLEGPRRGIPYPRHQRCWLHKTLNVLDKFPKLLQPNAHKDLREIWLSPNRASAEAAMATFAEKYTPKYDKAVECLIKDRQTLLTFFDLPANHRDHLRTSNPIESVFATVRHRTVRMKGALSQDTARLMVFKLVMAASRTWRRLQGQNQLPKVVNGIKFKDGIETVAEIKPAA